MGCSHLVKLKIKRLKFRLVGKGSIEARMAYAKKAYRSGLRAVGLSVGSRLEVGVCVTSHAH